MRNENDRVYFKEKVEDPWVSKFYGCSNRETTCTFSRPNKDRKYVKILALCLTYAPVSLIYPGVVSPLQHQLRDMCRAGLLQRYSKKGDRRFYYKTTQAGMEMLAAVAKGAK